MLRQFEEEKTRSASYLQRTLRCERENALDGVIHPLTHLFSRNGLARVTAVPTADVEGWLGQRRGLIEHLVVVDHLPLDQLLFFQLSFPVEGFGYFRALRDVSNQTFITAR